MLVENRENASRNRSSHLRYYVRVVAQHHTIIVFSCCSSSDDDHHNAYEKIK